MNAPTTADSGYAKSNVVIRPATTTDLSTICRLVAVQLSEHHISLPTERLVAAARGVLVDPGRGFFLVAWQEKVCVGVAYVSFVWTLEHGGHSAWLEELYVLPECRGEGVGTALLEAVILACEHHCCAAVDLEIDEDHDRVRSLYVRHGFVSLPRGRVVRLLANRGGN